MSERSAEQSIPKKVHALLLDAYPQRDDQNLATARDLAAAASGGLSSETDRVEVVCAIQTFDQAIQARSSSAETEQMLLHAIAAAQHWVRSSS